MTRSLVLPLALSFLWLPLAAQKRATGAASVTSYKLLEIKVTGTERYTGKDILPAIGLQIGQNVGEGDFKEAVRRLGETGLFTSVAYSFTFSSSGTKLEFQLQDLDEKKMVPVHFENFVWFSDAELSQQLAKRVPLFKGKLPVAGGLIDQVTEALQAMLDEKQIPGRVDYLREAPTEGADVTGFAYRVPDLAIRIHDVEFRGASPEFVPLLTAAAQKMIGADYVQSSLGVIANVDLLPVYLQRGYLKASFGPSDARVLSAPAKRSDDKDTQVDVVAVFPVDAGKLYSVSDVAWTGNTAFPSAQLQPLIHLSPGQPSDAVRLTRDLESVTRLYHVQGYMAARINPSPKFDDEKSTVHYDLVVSEGDRFKMGELDIAGLDSQLKARLEEAWALREGEPYNADYPRKFIKDNMGLLPEFTKWNISVHEAVNEKDKTVDVTVKYSPR